jgi:hypothetical protein
VSGPRLHRPNGSHSIRTHRFPPTINEDDAARPFQHRLEARVDCWNSFGPLLTSQNLIEGPSSIRRVSEALDRDIYHALSRRKQILNEAIVSKQSPSLGYRRSRRPCLVSAPTIVRLTSQLRHETAPKRNAAPTPSVIRIVVQNDHGFSLRLYERNLPST